MFSCDDVLVLLGEDSDQRSRHLHDELAAHLSRCRGCEVLVDSTRKTLRLLTESGSFDVPAELTDRILAAVRERRGED